MKKLKITIQGMHCASCASNIERSLSKVPGVKSVAISLMLNKGTVEIEDSVKNEELEKAEAKVGYKAIKIE